MRTLLFPLALVVAIGFTAAVLPTADAVHRCDPYAEVCPACVNCTACKACSVEHNQCSVCRPKR